MATLTISDAARVTGVSRMLLYRYIKSGKLSRTSDGLLDTAELLRAGLMLQQRDVMSDVTTLHDVTPGPVTHVTPDVTTLERLVDVLQRELDAATTREQDYREHIAQLTQMLQQSQQRYDRLLDTPRPPPALGGRGESEGTHAAAGGVSRSAPTRPPPPRAPRPSRGPAAAAPLSSTSLPANRILGKLCPRGHDYQGTGQSLLYVKNRVCVVCDRARQAQRRG